MRIIAISKLRSFYTKHSETETGLRVWIKKVRRANWEQPGDILNDFTHARPIGNGRVIFNINKNDYRLIVKVNYKSQQVFVCFVGSHENYDKIDPLTVADY